MKRCPSCNRTFEEDWLAFCTQDGTTLVEDTPAKADEPPPTIMAPPPPPPGGWQTPSGGLGSGQFQSPAPPSPPSANIATPSGGLGAAPYPPPAPMQPGWQPPPPPNYVQAPKQSFAIASMACGIFTVSIGWCCYLGTISGPVALALGIYQLVQIKNKPDEFTGKPFAIVGIATAAAYFVLLAIFILIYGVALFAGGMR